MLVMLASAAGALVAVSTVPLVTEAVINGPIVHHRGGLVPLAALALALGVGEGILLFVRRWILGRAATGVEADIRNDLYAKLQTLPVSFHERWQSGQLLSRATTDLTLIRIFVGYGLIYLVVNTMTFVYVVALLLHLDVRLGLVTVAAAVPIMITGARFRRDYHSASRRVQDQQGDLTTIIEEAALGIRVIKAFGRHAVEGARFASMARTLQSSSMVAVRLRARFFATLGLVPNLALAAIVLGGGWAVSDHVMTLGGLVAFVTLFLMLVWPVESLGEIMAIAQEASAAIERIWEVFDTPPDIADRPGAVDLDRCEGRLRFENVGFSYSEGGRRVLAGVDLEVAPGETVAIVGATASGKTTLLSLVSRLADVTDGRIAIDGHDIRDMTLASLRRHVAVAFEDPTLFSASVRENLTFGAPDATDAEIDAALDAAQARFAHHLPWGLDTRVGEQGLSLSGGQRQRLALARAILGRPRILVLDDPLSAVDVHTEAKVEAALARLLERTTALVVAHRPSTVALADRVAFLDGGRIVATGSHHELLSTVPGYRAVLAQDVEAPAGPPAWEATAV
ncbi:MAG TPA: ABC transporter ATP-binding protein [Acidimicrobiales bacterium]|nr:ABC transporter ATP-binding protein [Acidimicrobiales bacterium]